MIPRLVATPLPEQRADRTAPETAGLCPRGPARAHSHRPRRCPLERGVGKPGFPAPLPAGGCGKARPSQEASDVHPVGARCGGNRVSPHPRPRAGLGRLRPPPGGVWGNQVSPYPCVRARPSRRLEYGGTWFPQFRVSPTEPGTAQDGTPHPFVIPAHVEHPHMWYTKRWFVRGILELIRGER